MPGRKFPIRSPAETIVSNMSFDAVEAYEDVATEVQFAVFGPVFPT